MKSFEELQETMDLLNELVTNQSKALTLSKEIIEGKNKIIELCERETAIYKKENKVLKICFFGIIVCSVLQFMISCYANKG
jgi:hypothetical protein